MPGYNGANNLFHADVDCPYLHGDVREMPESTALKWGLVYCPDCNQQNQRQLET